MAANATRPSASTTGTSKGLADAGVVFVLSCLVFLCAHAAGFSSPWIINDDARQQIYWMQSWVDPDLYPPSLLNDYAERYVPAGIKVVYRVAAACMDPLQFTKVLTGVLFVLFCLAAHGIGRSLGGRRLGFAAAASAWLLPFFLKNISGGLSRAFAAPLLALFLLAWLRRSALAMGAVLLLQAVFIPYICVLAAASCVLARLWSMVRKSAAPPFPRRLLHFMILFACAFAVWTMQRDMNASGFGPLTGAADMTGRPEFGPHGRLDLFPLPNPFFDLVYTPMESVGLFLEWGLVPGIVSLALLLPVVVIGARAFDWKALGAKARPFVFTAAASLLLYAAARLLALKLFVPNRYVSYPFNLFYALALAACFVGFLTRVRVKRAALAGLLLAAAALGALRLHNVGLYDYTAGAPVYAALAETSKDALIAGHPEAMDNVLTFGKRNVLASFELAHPWSLGYWKRLEPRLNDLVSAYYAKDPAVVRDFSRRYGVDYILVEEDRFTPQALSGRPLFAPFDGQIRALAKTPGKFALLDPAFFPYKTVAPGVRLVRVGGP